jgi:hypothetical protein
LYIVTSAAALDVNIINITPGVRIVVASPDWSKPYRGRAREIVWDSIQQNEKKRFYGR